MIIIIITALFPCCGSVAPCLRWGRAGQAGAAKLCFPDPIPGRRHPDPWGEGDRGPEAIPREDGGLLQAAQGQGGEAVRRPRHRKFPLSFSFPTISGIPLNYSNSPFPCDDSID